MTASTGSRGKILILVENLPVPFDRRVWMESLALRDAGYTVSVISPCPPNELNEPHKVIEGIHVYRYKMPPPTQSKASFVYEFAYCWLKTWRLVRKVDEEVGFDVLQACNPPDTFWLIGAYYKRLGKRFVFDHHDLCPELYISKFNREDIFLKSQYWLERKTFQTADMVMCTNESYRDVAIQRGGKKPEDTVVVRSGPLLSRFVRCEPDESLKHGRKHLVVYLGVMGPQDGVDYALRAVKILVHDLGYKDAYYAFIGAGDSWRDLRDLAQSLDLCDHVEFPGRISDEDLKRYLSTASLGMAPDPMNPLNDVSTMNKIIEYMAMNLPVVSFDLKEARYSAGDAAIYVPPNDERLFAEAMLELLQDDDRRRQMGQLGRQRVEEQLAWDHSRKVLVAVYDRLFERYFDVNRQTK
jgi:glycosyltransferase involved in cell wall biosynthesis